MPLVRFELVLFSEITDVLTPEMLELDLVSSDVFTLTINFLFVLLLYVPSQQLWSWQDGQFT